MRINLLTRKYCTKRKFNDLIQGHQRFVKEIFPSLKKSPDVSKHQPVALFLGCSDSRISSQIGDSALGELFMYRTVGNFVVPYGESGSDEVSAALQLGHLVFGLEEMIVCGHSGCGAMHSLYKDEVMNHPDLQDGIQWLRRNGTKTVETIQTLKDYQNLEETFRAELTARVNVILQLRNLMTYPMVRERVNEGKLNIHGWFYHVENGKIEFYDDKTGQFACLTSALSPELDIDPAYQPYLAELHDQI